MNFRNHNLAVPSMQTVSMRRWWMYDSVISWHVIRSTRAVSAENTVATSGSQQNLRLCIRVNCSTSPLFIFRSMSKKGFLVFIPGSNFWIFTFAWSWYGRVLFCWSSSRITGGCWWSPKGKFLQANLRDGVCALAKIFFNVASYRCPMVLCLDYFQTHNNIQFEYTTRVRNLTN